MDIPCEYCERSDGHHNEGCPFWYSEQEIARLLELLKRARACLYGYYNDEVWSERPDTHADEELIGELERL